jgi:sporulation protein YlmC with PRC-barrel domain
MSKLQQPIRVVLSLGLIGVLSGYAWAAGRSDVQRNERPTSSAGRISSRQEMVSPESGAVLEKASKIIGSPVKGSDGKTLGKIHDIVLTPDLAAVSYVALSRGGFFGIGRTLYAVPWSTLQTGVDGTFYLPTTEERFLMRPGFKNAYWPVNASDRGWVRETTTNPGAAYRAPTREESQSVQYRRVDCIFGSDVKDAMGSKVGDIRDFIIVRDTGQVTYDIVSLGGFWGLGSKYSAVPWVAVNLQPQRHVATLMVDRHVVEANAFPPTQWPDLSSPAYAQRIDRLYNVQPSGVALGYVPAQPQSSAGAENPARGTPSPATPSPSAANLQTIKGTVINTMNLAGRGIGLEEMGLRLRTDQNNTITVQLGPRDYLDQQNFHVANGDSVTVTGKPIQVGQQSIFQATQVEKNGQILSLRNTEGQPLWLPASSKMNRAYGQMSQPAERGNCTQASGAM